MLASDHFIEQGVPVAIILRVFQVDPVLSTFCGILAGLVGTIPDTWPLYEGLKEPNDPRVLWKKFLFWTVPYRDDVYNHFHNREYPQLRWISWLWELHLWVDEPFHKPDGRWWPREWRRACMWWGIEIALIWLYIQIL